MSSALDRVVSITLVLGTVAVAGSFVYRTFRPAVATTSTAQAIEPAYEDAWRDALPYSTTILGPETARITVLEFTDLECPACRAYHPGLKQLVEKFPNDVRLAYVPFPLSIHRFALGAARAADCIIETEPERIGAWVDGMYAGQDSMGLKSWGSYAAAAGVQDTAHVARCALESTPRSRVDSGIVVGQRLGIRGTPSLVVNGWIFPGLPTTQEVETLIRRWIDVEGTTSAN